jgi:hypothetical protein
MEFCKRNACHVHYDLSTLKAGSGTRGLLAVRGFGPLTVEALGTPAGYLLNGPLVGSVSLACSPTPREPSRLSTAGPANFWPHESA